MKFIVIPVCDVKEKCKEWLDDLLTSLRDGEYFKKDYVVILCFDNCSEEFQKFFFEKYKGLNIAALDNRNPTNLNFCKNVNTGLRYALSLKDDQDKPVAEQVVILNMDTVLPSSHVIDFVITHNEGLTFPTPVGSIKDLQNLAPKKLDYTPVLKYSGFCMILSRPLLDKIGVLDERFIAAFDDDNVSACALLAGFPVQVVNINVYHDMETRGEDTSSTGAYTASDLGVRMGIFRRKWSIPASIPHEGFNQWILDNHTWREELKCV